MVKKQKLNYVDFIPGINIQWKITKDNLVEIIVENKGFYNVVARRLLKKQQAMTLRAKQKKPAALYIL